MDYATLIKQRAADLWNNEYARRQGGALRGTPGALLPLRRMLEDLAERACRLTVVEAEALTGTNILGKLDRDEETISIRPGLDTDTANFVIAHEIGHWALDHPLQVVLADTEQQINRNVTPDDLSVARQQRLTGIDLSPGVLTALRGYNERDAYEMQANAFATELLVPGADLRHILSADPGRSVTDLARQFGVAESLVRVGMANALFTATPDSARPSPTTPPPGPDLDEDQERAASSDAPATLVVAGPGAGKTRILTTRYARLVTEKGVSPRNILALTFANKAAGEMRERIAERLGTEHAASVEVFTFHAFGLQLLQQYGDRIGLKTPLRLVTRMDALLLFRRHAARQAYGFLSDLPRALENLGKQLDAVGRAKEENADVVRWELLAREWHEVNPAAEPAEIPAWAGDGLKFYQDYQATLRRHGLLDYGDLQVEAVRLFSIPEVATEIRDRYQHVLVDEFQDINYVSGRLVRELVGGRDGVLWVVGDPRQGIYGFRGASPVNLTRFRSPDYYSDAKVVALGRNYRSVPDIVKAGAAIDTAAVSPDPALVPLLRSTRQELGDGSHSVSSVRLPDGETERRWLVAEIHAEQAAGRRLSDIAVLVRKNKHAAQIAEALTAAGVPHRWGGPIEQRPAFRVLTSALLLAADDARGITGLTMLSPGAGLPPDFPLTEVDRRELFADGRGRWGARRLLRAAAEGHIERLSDDGRAHCRALVAVAEALSAKARPHHNLCVYLFEHALWLRALLPERVRTGYAAASVLVTTGQVLDLASGFASQRDALARSSSSDGSKNRESGVSPESEKGTPEDAPFETGTDTRAFLEYLTAALESGALGVPNELPLDAGCDAVTLMTAHRSKGLEWPVVFVPFCVDGQFPSRERDNDLPIPPGLIATDDADPSAAHAREETCLFYVALTRARDRLRLSGAASYGPRTKGELSRHRLAVEAALACSRDLSPEEADALPPLRNAEDTGVPSPPLVPYDVPAELHEASLTAYEACPRRFLFSEVYSLRQDGSAFLDYHNAVYRAARDCQGNPARLRETFEKNWEESGPQATDWQAPLLKQAAENVLRSMQRRLAGPGQEPGRIATTEYRQPKSLQIELPEGTGGGTHSILFTLDEESVLPDGRRHFRRHKQGGRLPKSLPDDDRATLYALYADQEAARGRAPAAEVVFHYPHVDADMPAKIGARKRENRRGEYIELLVRMKSGAMSPTPGDTCSRCAYRLICSRD